MHSHHRGWSRVLSGLTLSAVLILGCAVAGASVANAAEGNRSAAAKKAATAKATAKKKPVHSAARKPAARKTSVAKKPSPGRKVAAAPTRKGKTIKASRETVRVNGAQVSRVKATLVREVAPARLSVGEQLGLRAKDDPLDLNSSVALVVDQETNEVLFSKNDHAVLPIASLTKLMTGLIVADGHLDMNEMITITQDDVDTFKGSRSRLAVGTALTRGELMHLALMSSENRAAHALGRTYPGGMTEFVRLMNAKARELGMADTRYVEPTGLSSDNRSSARDLATLVSAAYQRPILRDLSTSPGYEVDVGRRTLQFNNSNRLVKNPEWDIGLQKTGYISEAGRCLVMQAQVAGRKLIMVFLDATGKLSRLQDAERVRKWVEHQTGQPVAVRPQG